MILPSRSISSSSSRTAAVTTNPPPNPSDPWTYPNALPRPTQPWRQNPKRKYPDRKAFQYAYYTHLSETSPLVLLFEYDNCNTLLLEKVRSQIAKLPPPALPFQPSSASSFPSSDPPTSAGSSKKKKSKVKSAVEEDNPDLAVPPDTRATFMVVRSGVLGAVHRARPRESSLAPWCDGQRAFIVCPVISGDYIGKVLKVVRRAVKEAQKPDSKNAKGSGPKQSALNLLVGLVEGSRVVSASEVEALTKTPDLDTLRAQVVGMLEGQGRSLVGVLGQAGGGGLVRTLQGLEAGMKDKEEGKAEP